MKNPHDTIVHPLITEKTVSTMERDNILTFIVTMDSTKQDILNAVEELYEVEVDKVTTTILSTGKKKAYVKLKEEYPADEVATKIGVF
ncbi:MAG: 50S ribosomal protein L23P [Candidatus Methanofastidiosum methylothiophilum]|uniref:Large ribosomal subunit protein uL23 n=1 Tax=Candidatus Methanofastidiosum methylothiophilum TaxID=1705564 RepID=A0A150IYQ1_9EURY|nr:MAG: 50S ribosomal protein L23P [Candidatus Methanofastidiosum methylthiophilus]NMC77055.1 50S ribosomal protein L23 [Candidatus Methanofastidiosa archaeon]